MTMTTTRRQPKLVVLVGPTAAGKTACSIQLAAQLNGEIISGDSMQFYRGLDIGTAKIYPAEMVSVGGQFIPHHLIDQLSPEQPYSVADFQRDTNQLVLELNARGKLPLLVGGTGLYVSAVVDGYTLEEQVPPDEVFRAQKRQQFAAQGGEALLAELRLIDPVSAAKLNPNDAKRIIRALEVFRQTGVSISSQAKQNPPAWQIVQLGITMEREALYQRIDQRVVQMMESGLVAEVQGLLDAGYGPELKPMQGLGYRQICSYLAGDYSSAEAVQLIQRDTRRFAKRQLTWWRRDSRIHWFNVQDYAGPQAMAAAMAQHLTTIWQEAKTF